MLIKSMINQHGDKSVLFQLSDEQNQRLKELLFKMCCDIVDFCERNNLVYMLGGGTALGAIRHKGFIPWDDDIDLNMPREDYDKFIPLFSEEFKGKYDVYVPDGIHKATALSMKIAIPNTVLEDAFHVGDPIKIGVNLDVFPIENVPNNKLMVKLKGILSYIFSVSAVSAYYYQNKSDKLAKLFSGNKKTKLIYKLRCLLGFLLSFKSYQWWFYAFDKFVQTKAKSEFITVPTGRRHYWGEIIAWKDIFPLKKANFNGREFNVYNNIEKYLTQLYGNYMELPPLDKREKHFYTNVRF